MKIHFTSKTYIIGSFHILRVPKDVSFKLPSRNIAAVKGTLNGNKFKAVLEPDGDGSHWLAVTPEMNVKEGEAVEVTMCPDSWPEPTIPDDFQTALDQDPEAAGTWTKATPMGRWEYIRWIRSTAVHETRQKRIKVACSKLSRGMRRPCCFNTSTCTVPEVSKGGALIDQEYL